MTHSQEVSFIVKCAGWKQNKFLEDDSKSINNHRVKFSQSGNVLGWVHLKISNSIKIGLKETLKCRVSVHGGGLEVGVVSSLFVLPVPRVFLLCY